MRIGVITLPSDYPNVTQILAGYKAFLPTYLADRSEQHVPSIKNQPFAQLDALEAYCNQGVRPSVCGNGLANQLLRDYETAAARAVGLYGDALQGSPGALYGGESAGGEAERISEDTAHLNDIAESDAAKIDAAEDPREAPANRDVQHLGDTNGSSSAAINGEGVRQILNQLRAAQHGHRHAAAQPARAKGGQ